jgi:hypothetical protein
MWQLIGVRTLGEFPSPRGVYTVPVGQVSVVLTVMVYFLRLATFGSHFGGQPASGHVWSSAFAAKLNVARAGHIH